MKKLVQPVTEAHIKSILDNLWQRGEEELFQYGLDKESAFLRFVHYAKIGISKTYIINSNPILACGIVTQKGESFTWFIATSNFSNHALGITHFLHREVMKHKGDLYIYSTCIHPDTQRWFNILGFNEDKWDGKTKSGFKLFRFKRR